MSNVDCPFYVTSAAVADFVALVARIERRRLPLKEAKELLIQRLHTANFCRRQENGLQLWRLRQDTHLRGRKLPRYRVLVSTERRPDGNLPQVVQVLPEHERHPR